MSKTFKNGTSKPRETFTYEGKRYEIIANTKKELAEKVARKKIALESGRVAVGGSTLVRDWARKWIATYKEPSVSDKTLEMYNYAISKINAEIGTMTLKSVRPLHCQNVLNALAGLSWSTARTVRQTLNALFSEAVRNGLIINNPAERLSLPKTHKGTHRALTEMERAYLLQVCETNKYGLWALVIYHCGLRPGETETIQGRDIDLKTRMLHVRGTKTASAERDVPIPAALVEPLRIRNAKGFEYLFANSDGRKINKTNRRRMWESIKKDIHIAMGGNTDYGSLQRVKPPYMVAADLVPYCLRHDYCTRLAEAGIPITTAKDLMGHADIKMTANIYTHVTSRSIDNARELIDSFNRQ
jgi:integrase